jgi:hypothetical protein
LFYGGGLDLLGKQIVAAVVVMGYSFVVTVLLAVLVKKVHGFRVSAEVEVAGIDEHEHAETAYSFTGALGARISSAMVGAVVSGAHGNGPVSSLGSPNEVTTSDGLRR